VDKHNEKKPGLPLRIGVGIILLNQKNDVFVGKRIDNPKNYWQMPQGGVDKDENFLAAAKRELEEETGVKSVEVIKKLDGWLQYNLPKNLLGKIWKGKYRGQKQKWFIMKFVGNNNEINVKTKNPEFFEWKWIKPSKLPNVAVGFKVDLYKKLKKELNFLNLN
jgi:putative (di)nucleoside polyphosphate hydrolase